MGARRPRPDAPPLEPAHRCREGRSGCRRGSESGIGAPALEAAATEILTSTRRGLPPEPWAPLTAREFEVARLIAEGSTNGEIAGDLGVTRKTAASHVEHILAKLGVGRRAEIAAWAASRPVLHSRPHGSDREE